MIACPAAAPPAQSTASPLQALPTVSVILACRNEEKHIEQCVRGVLAFELEEGELELIVSDGMSEDRTREIVRRIAHEDGRVRLIDNPHKTTPCGLNEAIRAARGEIVARVDAHTEYAPDYLRQCLAVMKETGADNVGGPALTRAGGYCQRAVAAAYHSRFAIGNSPFHQADYEGPADTTVYGCYRRDRLLQLGLFDEELVRNQDDELNFRLIRANGRIWQSPRIRSWYHPRASFGQLFQQYFQYGYWKVRVIQKHGTPASWRHLVPGTFAAMLTLLLPLSLLHPAAQIGLGMLLLVYGCALLGASVITALQAGWNLLPALPIAFCCYHLGYGYGFLAGVWDFVIHRKTSGRYVALTRR